MTVAFDAVTTASAAASNPSFTHTPVGTPRAVIAFVYGNASATFGASDVTYGGVTMTQVASITGSGDGGGYPDTLNLHWYLYFLGSSIPTGAQTAAGTRTGTGYAKLICITLTGADDTEVVDSDTVNTTSAATTSPTSLTLSSRTCWVGGAFVLDVNNPSAVTNYTLRGAEPYYFAYSLSGVSRDAVDSNDLSAFTMLSHSSATAVGVTCAVSEVVGGGGGRITPRLAGLGGLAGMGGLAGQGGGLAGREASRRRSHIYRPSASEIRRYAA
jgi:hypothetical protein